MCDIQCDDWLFWRFVEDICGDLCGVFVQLCVCCGGFGGFGVWVCGEYCVQYIIQYVVGFCGCELVGVCFDGECWFVWIDDQCVGVFQQYDIVQFDSCLVCSFSLIFQEREFQLLLQLFEFLCVWGCDEWCMCVCCQVEGFCVDDYCYCVGEDFLQSSGFGVVVMCWVGVGVDYLGVDLGVVDVCVVDGFWFLCEYGVDDWLFVDVLYEVCFGMLCGFDFEYGGVWVCG